MLMLLSVHVTGILFLVQFNNFTLTMGFYWSYTLLLQFLCALAYYDVTGLQKDINFKMSVPL